VNVASISFASILLATSVGTAHAREVTGSWEYRGRASSGIWLKTLQEGKGVRFQLEIARGSPSYNSGWIQGTFDLEGSAGTFRGRDAGCEISFQFVGSSVRITPVEGKEDCGFGYNVRPEGTLLRKNRKKPRFSIGDPRSGSE
jgi:hypothetical protein